MATNRTFSVKNGIDVANTIIVDANRNVSNVNITSALINVTTANITTIQSPSLTAAYDQANSAYTAANSAANTVRVSGDGASTQNKSSLNFNSSGNVAVTVGAGSSGNANVTFDLTDTSVAANTYGGATAVPVITVDAKGRITSATNVAIGGGTVTQVNTGVGLNGGPITSSGTIAANIASTNTQGVTKLIDVVTSTDTGNAATANAVNTAYTVATGAYDAANNRVLKAGDTMTGALVVQANVTACTFLSSKTTLQAPTTANFNGERLRLYDFNEAGHPNYALGVEANFIWAGTDENNGQTGFKWYGNTTQSGVLYSNGSFAVSNTVQGKVLKATGTGTAVDASQGNILTNQVTGTQFNFLAGANTIVVNASGATANYTLSLPPTAGIDGQVLATDGTGDTYWSSSVFDSSNTANAAANTVRVSANGASTVSKAQLNFINTASIIVSVSDAGNGNANISFVTSGASAADAYNQANDAYTRANTANAQANLAYTQANDAYTRANTANAQANLAYTQANDAYTRANTANAQANLAYTQANGAYTQANTAWSVANLKIETLNSGLGIAIADGAGSPNVSKTISANLASTTVQGITKLVDSVSSTDTANAATANAVKTAWDYANTKVALTADDQTITGKITITSDLSVQGNLFLTGNASYLNVATVKVNDSIIQLSTNSIADVLDIGFVGHYSPDGGTTNLHSGLIRHASDDVFYLFDAYPYEPANNVVDVNSINLATLRANINAASIVINGSPVALAGTTTDAYNQANDAYTRANTANAQANLAYTQANAAYSTANLKVETITTGLGLNSGSVTTGNVKTVTVNANVATTSTQGITKLVDAINSNDTGNAATANAVTWLGTTKVSKSGDTMTGKLTISTGGEGLEVASANVSANIKIDQLFVLTATLTTTSTSQATLDIWSATAYTSAKYWIQMKQGSVVHTTEVAVVHDGSTAYITEYGTLLSAQSLATFDASVSGGNLSLLVTPTSATSTTIKAVRYGVV